MYERKYGWKYDQSLDVAAIAKRMRQDIASLVEAGALPGKPTSYSVTIDRYSMGQSIDIVVRDWPGQIQSDETYGPGSQVKKPTPEATAIVKALNEVHAAYNHDGSDVMTDYFDVNYYGQVRFESSWEREQRAKQAAKRRAMKDQPRQKRPDRRGLAQHVAWHHRRRGTDRMNFDLLSAVHGAAHNHGAHPFDTDHKHQTAEVNA